MILKYFLHLGVCLACAILSIVALELGQSYADDSQQGALLISGVLVAIGVVATKLTDKSPRKLFQNLTLRGFLDDYLVTIIVVLLVLNAAFGGGFSEEPTRLIVLGLLYIAVKHLLRANEARFTMMGQLK